MAFYSLSFPKDRICRINHASDLYECLCHDMGFDPFSDVRVTVRVSGVSRPTPDHVIVYKGILHFPEHSDLKNVVDLIFHEPKQLVIRDLPIGNGFRFTFESRGIKCKIELCGIPFFLRTGIENAFSRHLASSRSEGDNDEQNIHLLSLKIFFERSFTAPPEIIDEENSWIVRDL